MFRAITLLCSLTAVVIGGVYSEQRGLVIDVTAAGEAIYSSSLQSSGADDAFLVRIGFASFIVSAAGSLLAYWRARAAGALKWVYGANVAFLVFVMWLVNLDVPVFRSVRHGDHLLAAGWVIVAIPFLLLSRRAWRDPSTTWRTARSACDRGRGTA